MELLFSSDMLYTHLCLMNGAIFNRGSHGCCVTIASTGQTMQTLSLLNGIPIHTLYFYNCQSHSHAI